jgi:hypothetical protein
MSMRILNNFDFSFEVFVMKRNFISRFNIIFMIILIMTSCKFERDTIKNQSLNPRLLTIENSKNLNISQESQILDEDHNKQTAETQNEKNDMKPSADVSSNPKQEVKITSVGKSYDGLLKRLKDKGCEIDYENFHHDCAIELPMKEHHEEDVYLSILLNQLKNIYNRTRYLLQLKSAIPKKKVMVWVSTLVSSHIKKIVKIFELLEEEGHFNLDFLQQIEAEFRETYKKILKEVEDEGCWILQKIEDVKLGRFDCSDQKDEKADRFQSIDLNSQISVTNMQIQYWKIMTPKKWSFLFQVASFINGYSVKNPQTQKVLIDKMEASADIIQTGEKLYDLAWRLEHLKKFLLEEI